MRSSARLLCALGALSLLVPGAAQAKRRQATEAAYTVIARATMEERWQFLERSEIRCLNPAPGTCTVETSGSGTAKMQLKAKPTTWLVMRGANGRPPSLNVGTGEGAQLRGSYLRTGKLETIHGGPWAEANPPEIAETSGCGTKDIEVDFNLSWEGRNQLAPSAIVSDQRDDCPDGPNTGLEWDDDESPSLMDVVTQAAQSKFLKTKQFTVSGTKSWHASATPPTGSYVLRSGEKTVKWSWSVTFQMNKKRR